MTAEDLIHELIPALFGSATNDDAKARAVIARFEHAAAQRERERIVGLLRAEAEAERHYNDAAARALQAFADNL